MKLLMLDVDGVLNDHSKWPNGYCRIDYARVPYLNRILDSVPGLQVALTSSWRYAFDRPHIVEALLLVHGINAHGRGHGCTLRDPVLPDAPPYTDTEWWDRMGRIWRRDQITDYIETYEPERFAVLDDIPIEVPHLFLCDPSVGLTGEIADAVVQHFAVVARNGEEVEART